MLLWAARRMPLIPGIWFLWISIGMIVNLVRGDFHSAGLSFWIAPTLLSLPLLLAVIAWRWHLIGGVLIILFTTASVSCQLYGSSFWGVFDLFTYYALAIGFGPWLLFFAGGILHLIAWRQEKKQALN